MAREDAEGREDAEDAGADFGPLDPDGPGALFESFGDLFGSPPWAVPASPDLRVTLPLSASEAAEGVEREVWIHRFVGCEGCDGQGGAPEARLRPCARCAGAGRLETTRGAFRFTTTCNGCHGRGGSWDRPCDLCDGTAGEMHRTSLRVRVPPGVTDGQALRLRGAGHAMDEQRPGDVYVDLRVGPGAALRRRGNDLYARARVSREVAREGGSAKVELPQGVMAIDVPPGTAGGDERRLPGFGALAPGAPNVPLPVGPEAAYRAVDARAHRGDLVVMFEVEGEPVPEAWMTEHERARRDVQRSDRRFWWAVLGAVVLLAATWLLTR
ncbi:MAG TPA: DnaJ C-terminal domain-containing protein [Sandaracinaceae bacterium LLY-WYZ-13_1]|nr:DnaJ C-terminal domain-containing protein [Sandaracinaceae bacterium LLY-WYZ-13_1]